MADSTGPLKSSEYDSCSAIGCHSCGGQIEHEKTLSRLCEVVVRLEKDGDRRQREINELRRQQEDMVEQLFKVVTEMNEKINAIRSDIKKDSEQTKLWLITLLLTIVGSVITFVVTSGQVF